MVKTKINKEGYTSILKIVAKYLYDKKLKKHYEDILQKKEEFAKEIYDDYIKTFNTNQNLINFAKKYNIYDELMISVRDYNNTFNTYKSFCIFSYEDIYVVDNNCIQTTQCSIKVKLPYQSDLSYIPLNNNDYNYYTAKANKLFTDKFYKIYKEYENKCKEVFDAYKKFKNIITSCKYYEEIKEYIQFDELNRFIDNKVVKKLSTDLCTLNNETIDFVKNYLESIDN